MRVNKAMLFAGLSSLALSTVAYAQDGSADAAEAVSEVVVTGSRVISNGNNMPTPVTVVRTDELLRTSPANVPEALKKLPAFALSRGVGNLNNPTDNFTGNYLNLRGFGIQRNLILLDGHRVAPTSYTGAVDANVLPQMLLQRVEVVTGGASAVYGSDAVSGVVNFILDKNFNGLKAEAQSGISGHNDAFSYRGGVAFGTNLFDGRGHFEASFEHFQQDGLSDKFDRANGRKVYAIAGNGVASDPFRLIENARATTLAFKGLILTGPYAGQVFGPNGVPQPFVHGTPQGATLESGGDGFFGLYSSATADLETDQAFARFDFDLAENVNFYVQGNWAKAETYNNFYPNLIFPHVIAPDNAYLPASVRANLTEPFLFDKVWADSTVPIGVLNQSKYYTISTGLDATFGGVTTSLFYQHGVSRAFNYTINDTYEGRLSAALDAVDQGLATTGVANGNIVCRVTVTNPSAYPGCVPVNPFGADPTSQSAALKYYLGNSYNRPEFVLDSIEASATGTAFENWAGPVRVALSGQYRWLSLDVETNSPNTAFANCAGLRFDCTQGVTPLFRTGGITPIKESESVGEGAVEVEFPLLVDSPFARSLSLNAAARYTDYSTSGSVTTWKIGGDWQLNDSLRVRATRSREIRAPSLYERYQPSTRASSGYQDLHTGVGGVFPTETTGNVNLKPEKADVLTIGVVFRPTSVPGLSFALDYYQINMDNAIASIDGRSSAIQQVREASGGVSDFCSLYVRPLPFSNRTAANAPTTIKLQTLNASSVKTRGVDAEANYTFDLGPGRMSLRGLVSYQPRLTTILAPGLPAQYGAGAAASQGTGGVPKWRLTGFVSYSTDLWTLDIQERWRSSLKWDANRELVFNIPDVKSVGYTDVTLTWNVGRNRDRQVFFSVQNLFDQDPPVFLTAGTSGTPAFSFPAVTGDDIIGRYFTVGARLRL